jgi:hypothetical protein
MGTRADVTVGHGIESIPGVSAAFLTARRSKIRKPQRSEDVRRQGDLTGQPCPPVASLVDGAFRYKTAEAPPRSASHPTLTRSLSLLPLFSSLRRPHARPSASFRQRPNLRRLDFSSARTRPASRLPPPVPSPLPPHRLLAVGSAATALSHIPPCTHREADAQLPSRPSGGGRALSLAKAVQIALQPRRPVLHLSYDLISESATRR